ncbi:hypothetical protein [Kitasatospora sp. NPDC089509]|uniref:hypothetical protein n=1 Tax=Kitasatospora sp. NPDC089509 TaxID=3364079 RepID=UPI003803B525
MHSIERRTAAAQRLLDVWTDDVATAQEFPGARWTLDADANLHGTVGTDSDAAIWADYLGIVLVPAPGGRLGGRRDYTPDGPFGPVVTVALTVDR